LSKVIMIIAGFVTTVYRKPGRAFEAVGGKLESESPTQSPTQSTDPVVRLLYALKDGNKTAGDQTKGSGLFC